MTVNFILPEHVTRMLRSELERRANTLQRHVGKLTEENRRLKKELRDINRALGPAAPVATSNESLGVRRLRYRYLALLEAAMDQPTPTAGLIAAVDRAVKESTRLR